MVLPWTKTSNAQGNIIWGNQARNFTIDTGSGNPGAIGMTFMGANGCSLDNVTIRSGDGQGLVGLDFPWWSVQGHFTDITVEGFDYGMRILDNRENQPTLENVTLRKITRAGIRVQAATALSVRKLDYSGDGPAVEVRGEGAHLVMVDSKLTSPQGAEVALDLGDVPANQAFLRNIEIRNFQSSLRESGTKKQSGKIREYVTGEILAVGSTPKRSLDLPVEEVRLVPWEKDPGQWASPEDFEGSETERIQAALNSGKPAIYFPKSYYEGGEFTLPATVRQIDFLHLDEVRGRFIVSEPSQEPLWIEHAQRRLPVDISAQRNVHFRFGSNRVRVLTDLPVSVHYENLAVLTGAHDDRFCPPHVRVYARSINDEDRKHPNNVVNGGLLWVLGFKTEAHRESFLVKNRGVLEVLGGYRNHAGTGDQGLPLVHNVDGHVSLVACNYMSRAYKLAVRDDTGRQSQTWDRDQFPVRVTGHPHNYFIPLFVSYNSNRLAETLLKSARN